MRTADRGGKPSDRHGERCGDFVPGTFLITLCVMPFTTRSVESTIGTVKSVLTPRALAEPWPFLLFASDWCERLYKENGNFSAIWGRFGRMIYIVSCAKVFGLPASRQGSMAER